MKINTYPGWLECMMHRYGRIEVQIESINNSMKQIRYDVSICEYWTGNNFMTQELEADLKKIRKQLKDLENEIYNRIGIGISTHMERTKRNDKR